MVSLSTITDQCTRFFGNDQSALQAIQIVDDKISREVSLGRMAGPRSPPYQFSSFTPWFGANARSWENYTDA